MVRFCFLIQSAPKYFDTVLEHFFYFVIAHFYLYSGSRATDTCPPSVYLLQGIF